MNNVVENLILPAILKGDPFNPHHWLKVSRVCKEWREVVKKLTFHHLWPRECILQDFPPPDGPQNELYVWQRRCYQAFIDTKWWERPQLIVLRSCRLSGKTRVLLELAARLNAMQQFFCFYTTSTRAKDVIRPTLSELKYCIHAEYALFHLYDDIDFMFSHDAVDAFAKGHHVVVTCTSDVDFEHMATQYISLK